MCKTASNLRDYEFLPTIPFNQSTPLDLDNSSFSVSGGEGERERDREGGGREGGERETERKFLILAIV